MYIGCKSHLLIRAARNTRPAEKMCEIDLITKQNKKRVESQPLP